VLLFHVSVRFCSHFFFFFAAASTSNALPTIESLNAEKAKLEAEKEKLEDELEAGVSDALEVAIRQQITGIDARITGRSSRHHGDSNANHCKHQRTIKAVARD
jgi:hypothetical protein